MPVANWIRIWCVLSSHRRLFLVFRFACSFLAVRCRLFRTFGAVAAAATFICMGEAWFGWRYDDHTESSCCLCARAYAAVRPARESVWVSVGIRVLLDCLHVCVWASATRMLTQVSLDRSLLLGFVLDYCGVSRNTEAQAALTHSHWFYGMPYMLNNKRIDFRRTCTHNISTSACDT